MVLKTPAHTRKRFRLGRRAFEKVSAVEGIVIDSELDADFAEFDRQGMSAAERRKAIGRKYGKGRV